MVGTISLTDVHKIPRHNAGDALNDMINDLPEDFLLHILSLSVFILIMFILDMSHPIKIRTIPVDADKVGYLISSAMKHEIQYLRLSLGDSNYQFMLPHSLSAFASLNELWLGLKFTLHIPSGICFPSLKKLVGSNFTFANENSVQQLCYWKNIEEINVAIFTLRNLRIRSNILCIEYDHDMTLKIDICTIPRILSISFLFFHNLTHLDVKFLTPKNTSEVLLDILRNTPKLEVLTIPGVVNDLNGGDLMLNSAPYCFKYSLNQL
ncbi:hypothetical protein QL285_027653 [Trifolium repens]|nr:hypothetical protein QL285_027653 [Trifolium repens]